MTNDSRPGKDIASDLRTFINNRFLFLISRSVRPLWSCYQPYSRF